ncbi:MAG: hypothetical protein JST92_26415, partial [Deltaproteobacteria bacterium]|nr:hypothetical protein [Deltaproteobacteria bacterium]
NVLFREDTRRYASANGNIYEVSPVETAAARCSASGGGLSFCASTITATIPNLNSTASLVGTNTAVYNCKGANYPSAAGSVTTACSSINSTGSAFTAAADTTWKSLTDDFSGQMAYFHLDKHVSFFKSIDSTLPPAASGGPGRVAIRNSIPALVNSYEGSQPLENAFFSGTLGAMVFGQGADADYAYDATVMYHEFTHGVVNAWGDFNLDIDSEGGLDEPGAVNEGSADSMAVSETGRSQIGSFVSSTGSSPSAFLRDLNDANNKRSCHGDGTTTNQFGATVLRGLDGEVHDDGEIWNGYFWEIYSGLKTAGLKGCGGNCEAGAAIMYKAIELAGGGGPQYSTYPGTFKSAAQALFPGNTALTDYITCVGTRRGMDQCDRTTPVYAGESKAEFIRLRYGSFQPTFTTTGTSSFQICSVNGTATRVHLRKGSKLALTSIQSSGAATVTEDSHVDIQTTCPTGQTVTLP